MGSGNPVGNSNTYDTLSVKFVMYEQDLGNMGGSNLDKTNKGILNE